MFTPRKTLSGFACILLLASAFPAAANWKPSRPMTLIVPFAAGGPSDAVARLVSQRMSTDLGQTIVIENLAGASGTIGATRLARSAPDGQTLLLHHLALIAAPGFYSNLQYDTRAAFAPVGVVNTGPMAIVAGPHLKVKSIADLIDLARASPRPLTFAHAGQGSNPHLCGIFLGQGLKVEFQFVPYRGTGPAMNDLIAGNVDLLCDQLTTTVPQIQSGAIRGLAVTAKQRVTALPEIQTMAEAGYPNVDISVWNGLYAPAGTPEAVLTAINGALDRALDDTNTIERLETVGMVAATKQERSRSAHRVLFEQELDRWATTLKAAGIVP